jgi:hypothetical protein
VRSGQPYPRLPASLIVRRLAAALLLSTAATAAATCGGSTAVETVVGPDAVRCQTTLNGPPSTIPPAGGSLNITVSAARDCTWTASGESWMQLNATSGQGDSTLQVTIARNDVPSTRTGAVSVNDQRFAISQEARPCTYELRATPPSMSSEGGRGSIAVETLSGCAWTATSSAGWLQVLTASGTGSGTVGFEAASNGGGARQAAITIGGQSVTIEQAAAGRPGGGGCDVTLAPTVVNATPAGGTHPVTLTLNTNCEWSTSSNASWVTVSPSGGRGNGTLTLTVARNSGNARSATITAGDRSVTVNQAAMPACTATIDPPSSSYTEAGGGGSVRVTTPDGCEWTATNGGASWVTFTNSRGMGPGDATFTVARNTNTSARSASLTIGGRTHSVSQQAAAPTCTFRIDPGSRSIPAAGGDGSFQMFAPAGCTWSATVVGTAAWLTLNTSQGSGDGSVSYTVQGNNGSARTIGISAGGQTHTVSQQAQQAPTCTYQLQPSSRNFGAGASEGRFNVVTQQGCSWQATSNAPDWATLVTTSGSGPSEVIYNVQANGTGASRSTSISVNDQSHGITQEAAAPTCTYSISATQQSFGPGAGSASFTVTTQTGCAWTASAGAGWVQSGQWSGSGPGTAGFSVQANSGAARQTTITLNNTGPSVSITQEAAAPTCTYSVAANPQNFAAGGGGGTLTVTTQAGCAWTASAGAGWVIGGSWNGSGPGSANFTVQPNSGAARQTAITLNNTGPSANITQDAAVAPPPPPPCTYSLDSSSRDFSAAGGEGVVRVTTGPSCAWSASAPSGTSWISVGSPQSPGSGEVRYTVAPNSGGGGEREVTLTIAGQSHRVRQTATDDDR